GATSTAPSSANTAASACPASMTVTPAAPTVSEAFAPTSVAQNAASTLTITLTNSNGFALTQASFNGTLASGLSIQPSPARATTPLGGRGAHLLNHRHLAHQDHPHPPGEGDPPPHPGGGQPPASPSPHPPPPPPP